MISSNPPLPLYSGQNSHRKSPTLPTVPHLTPLQHQHPSYAPPETKIRLSILATAMVDALGGPAEFQPRFSFDPITTMVPNDNFNLPQGVWTDDTSMTLCLARSLAHSPDAVDGFDERNQLQAYSAWFQRGELSAIGRCFDIGGSTNRALRMFQTYQHQSMEEVLRFIKKSMSGNVFGGNGSLMRVLPVGLAYWRDEEKARKYARRSSCTTHPNILCVEACEVWTAAIVKVMQAATQTDGSEFSKLDLLEHFAQYPYSCDKLRQALAVPSSATPLPAEVSPSEKEGYYWFRHPLLQKITEANKHGSDTKISGIAYRMPSASQVPSTGFVLSSFVAALYCFMSTQTFEEGALMAVNMGDDADTVGAIYAGLAGVWYAETGLSNRFWSKNVLSWKNALVKRELVEQVANELTAFSGGLAFKP